MKTLYLIAFLGLFFGGPGLTLHAETTTQGSQQVENCGDDDGCQTCISDSARAAKEVVATTDEETGQGGGTRDQGQ